MPAHAGTFIITPVLVRAHAIATCIHSVWICMTMGITAALPISASAVYKFGFNPYLSFAGLVLLFSNGLS